MKKMSCYELGGACNEEFYATTFKEMAELSKKHAMEMLQKGDQDHMNAMQEMKHLMDSPQSMQKWMQEKEELFNSLDELD
ncbi:MAG: DUF1059 domain-containing protein [Flavobacteriaceae bacterium]|jgi:cell fate (sporulation/competence/biofilm development) regulator YlbF (YheA/YmcA/DUF963 family)|nr:DUF1059 domain-containing protein [Flavobacteriaceae bacterium]NVJ72773.1 DUF1059 domain-containing protein [Flavobacteriaceae bacterium]